MKLALVVLVAVVGMTVWSFLGTGAWRSSAGEDRFEQAVFEVRRGDLRITISENGYLKAKNSQLLKPEFKGEGTITWLEDEGAEVGEGAKLVEFDTNELERQISEVKDTLIQYQTELEAARAELQIQRRDNVAAIEKADLDLEVKRLVLKRYEEGEYPNELRKMKLAVEKAESAHERAKEAYDQVPTLEAEGFLTKIQAEEERIKLREAEINEENATQELELYTTYTYPMERKQKETDVEDAERTLLSSREKADINLKEKEARIASKERQVAQTEARLAKLEEDLASHVIVAPNAGVVHYGDPGRPWQHDQIQVGNRVSHGLVIVTLPDLSEMQVNIDVHEADINRVDLGQDVLVTIDSHKGQVFRGEVSHIDAVASSDWGDEANKRFGVEVTMESTERELRAGISAKVEILVAELEDVLFVPIHAVFAEGEEYFCFTPDEGGFQRRAVEIGPNNAHHVEVASGLEEGDVVLLYDPREEGRQESEPTGAEDAEGSDEGSLAPAELAVGG